MVPYFLWSSRSLVFLSVLLVLNEAHSLFPKRAQTQTRVKHFKHFSNLAVPRAGCPGSSPHPYLANSKLLFLSLIKQIAEHAGNWGEGGKTDFSSKLQFGEFRRIQLLPKYVLQKESIPEPKLDYSQINGTSKC